MIELFTSIMKGMDLGAWLKKLTIGKVIFKTESLINREIQIIEDFYGKRVVVGGLTQSGGQVKRIWKKAVRQIAKDRRRVARALILGLGAGTLAELVSRKWPEAKIVGVEIDSKIIEVGKKYFGLGKIPNLEIVLADAAEFIRELKIGKEKPEVIFVDLYLADKVPSRCETMGFLEGLKQVLAPGGLIVFNRLAYKEHKKEVEELLDKVEKIFQTIRKKKVGGNLLIFAQKKNE